VKLGSGSRHRFRLSHWQLCCLPPVGAFRVPIHTGITPSCRSLRRIPAHPAFGQAVEYHRSIPLAPSERFEALAEMSLESGTESPSADIGKPETSRDVAMRQRHPQGGLRKRRGPSWSRQHINPNRFAAQPQHVRSFGIEDDPTRHRGRGRRAVIVHPIPFRLRRVPPTGSGIARYDKAEKDACNRLPQSSCPHGPMSCPCSSSSGTP
jgi:hypothetical protein